MHTDPLVLGVAAAALVAMVAYGVFAGADFGGGIWDLFASGPRKKEQREAIAKAMAPVWEANHVWLIFVIVLLFSGFPRAFAALSVGLFAPLHLALVGIILRGAAFVFRAYGPRTGSASWGAVFGAASTITPVLLGMSLGAIATGTMRVSGGAVSFAGGTPWLMPVSLTIGALTLALSAYLAAVFLTLETSGALREDFRKRAIVSGTFVVALSGLALPLLYVQARHVFDGLTSPRALPVFALGIASALASGLCLRIRQYRFGRIAASAQIALLLIGFGLAQYPYLIFPDVTLSSAAAPANSLRFILWSLPPGALVLGPSLFLLFRVFKRARAA